MTYFAILLVFCHFVYLFVCSFSAVKRSYPTIPLNRKNTGIESQTNLRLHVMYILCPFELSLRRVFSGSYRSCSFLKYQYFQQISIIIQLESKKSHGFASSKHAALSSEHAANRDFLTVHFNCKYFKRASC